MILAVIFRITDIWKMGAPGCASVEYSAYSAGASGQFTQRNWLGTVYRCSHPYSQRTGPTHCISSLGTSGPDEKSMLNNPKHLILEAPHPSPLSAYRGFFGCRHFSRTNEFLRENGLEPVDWQIENKDQV